MKYLLIILGIALVLSPLLALQPSRRQRQLQRLRAKAITRGLQVKYPEGDQVQGRLRAISYRMQVAHERQLDSVLAAPMVFERIAAAEDQPGSWGLGTTSGQAEAMMELLYPTLETLPIDVFQLTLTRRHLSAEWYECGRGFSR